MQNFRSWFVAFITIVIFLILGFGAWLYSQIDGSLPQLEGKKTIYGLSTSATIERDSNGIATIKAANRLDLAVATGFVHAQERFFQMDLLRRNAAGELSSLFGKVALDYDKAIRVHRFRDRARAIVKQLPVDQYNILKSYTRGVNQGLELLYAQPFEYLFLQTDPVAWQEEDTILAVFSMYIDLQDEYGDLEQALGTLETLFPPEVFNFIAPQGSKWDAAIDGSQQSWAQLPTSAWPAASPSNNSSKILSAEREQLIASQALADVEHLPGSNNWAVSGQISTTNSAIVANDMHLGIRVPNTWYRARFEYQTDHGESIAITGVTLPGAPNMIVGSNGNIAWGFTNSYGDWHDIITLETNQDNSAYLTPDGYLDFTYQEQMIAIKDQKSVSIQVRETIWGPVIGEDHQGNLLAYRWVAHDLNAVNLNIIDMEQAKTVEQAFAVAATAGVPAQNLMVGDSQGNIGWTIMGPIPRKSSNFGRTPKSWSNGEHQWQGYLSANEYPRVYNPAQLRLWTGNSRVVGGENFEKIGSGGYALGARSQQIRDRLMAKEQFDEQALLDIALDDEALFLQRWQRLLLEQVLTEDNITQQPQWREAKQYLNTERLAADSDSVAYRIVRNFRLKVRNLIFTPLIEQILEVAPDFKAKPLYRKIESPLWLLASQQPNNYLLQPFDSWQALFAQALTETLEEMTQEQSLAEATWGQQNTGAIQHPLSRAVPILGTLLNLDMPAEPMSGDTYMPRVQGTTFGASERMVVSPGHEQSGIFHMPSSQSGHPWSPYYGNGHQDWQQGKSSSFLPGKTKYSLTLLSY